MKVKLLMPWATPERNHAPGPTEIAEVEPALADELVKQRIAVHVDESQEVTSLEEHLLDYCRRARRSIAEVVAEAVKIATGGEPSQDFTPEPASSPLPPKREKTVKNGDREKAVAEVEKAPAEVEKAPAGG